MNIKVDLSNFIFNSKQFALIYVDFNSMRTVADVIHHICTTFNLSDTVDGKNYTLYDDIWYIPSNQSSYIFKDITGIIRVFDNEIIQSKEMNSESVENSLHNNNNNVPLFAYKQNSESISVTNPKLNSYVQNFSNVYLNNHNIEDSNISPELKVTTNAVTCTNKQDSIGDIHLEKTAENVTNKIEESTCIIASDDALVKVTPKHISDCETTSDIIKDIKNNNTENRSFETCSMNRTDVEDNGETLNNFSRDIDPLVNSNSKKTEEYKSVNSFSGNDESILSPIKRKRKRKHNKHKKNKIREIAMLNGPPDEMQEKVALNHVPYKFTSKKGTLSPVKRKHQVFDSSDDEDNAESNFSFNKNVQLVDNSSNLSRSNGIASHKQKITKRRSTDINSETLAVEESIYENSKHKVVDQNANLASFVKNQNMDDCESNFSVNENTLTENSSNLGWRNETKTLKQKTKRRYRDINLETMSMEESTYENSKHKVIDQNANLSSFAKDQILILEPSADVKRVLEPPVGCYEYPEPSSDVKFKFRNLLNLEMKHIPKKFIKTRDSLKKNYSQEAIDSTWHSLPRSFASRKERTVCRSDEVISLNTAVTNIHPVSRFTDAPKNDANKEEYDANKEEASITEEKTSSKTNVIGAKPSRRNVGYMQSIGSALSLLKSLNNSRSTSRRSTPDSHISDSELTSTQLNSNTQIQETNGLSFSPQLYNSLDSNYKCNIDNKMLIETSCTESNEIDRTLLCDDADSSVLILSKECNENFEHNTKEKKLNENLICNNRILEDEPHVSKEGQKSDLTGISKGKHCDINFESYPLLNTEPKPGDIIAAKVLSTDRQLSPSNSEYRPAKVISVHESKLNLQFLDNEVLNNKEENVIDIEEEETLTVDWRDLQLTRLIFP